MYALEEESGVPWQRVINARGEVSMRSEPGREGQQQAILESEGVLFDDRGRVDLERFLWDPPLEFEDEGGEFEY
jgi:methylated-DNA-protein-cysteine methyltransferase-like protein